MASEFRIVQAVSAEDRARVFRMRYDVFVKEMGYVIPGVTEETGLVESEDEHSRLFLAYDGDEPAGTLAYDWWHEVDFDETVVDHFHFQHFADAYGKASVTLVRKTLVLPEYRRTSLMMTLLRTALAFAASQPEIHFAFTDCSPYLVRFYERFGARRYASHFSHDDSGILSVPLCFVLDDFEHFQRVRSRIFPVIKEQGRKDDPAVRHFFEDGWSNASLRFEEDQEPHMPSEEDLNTEVHEIPIFAGIDEDAVDELIAQCTTITFGPKDVLMAVGDKGADLYLLTKGFVEVTHDRDGKKIALATRGPGDILGEMSLLLGTGRTATVTGLTTGEALRVTESTIQEFLSHRAEIGAQIYWNLACMLADRLRGSDTWITESPPL